MQGQLDILLSRYHKLIILDYLNMPKGILGEIQNTLGHSSQLRDYREGSWYINSPNAPLGIRFRDKEIQAICTSEKYLEWIKGDFEEYKVISKIDIKYSEFIKIPKDSKYPQIKEKE